MSITLLSSSTVVSGSSLKEYNYQVDSLNVSGQAGCDSGELVLTLKKEKGELNIVQINSLSTSLNLSIRDKAGASKFSDNEVYYKGSVNLYSKENITFPYKNRDTIVSGCLYAVLENRSPVATGPIKLALTVKEV